MLSRICASVLVDVVYIPQTGNDEIMDLRMEVYSMRFHHFIAYAQSIYLTCMRNYARLSGGRHA